MGQPNVLLFFCLLALIASIYSQEITACWRDAFARGVGKSVLGKGHKCPTGMKLIGLLCYENCVNDEVEAMSGLACKKKTTPPPSQEPKTKLQKVKGFFKKLNPIANYRMKKPHGLGCPDTHPDAEFGLCYKTCDSVDPNKQGYLGKGPICWQPCPTGLPYRCGAGCVKNKKECVTKTINDVLIPFKSASNIAKAAVPTPENIAGALDAVKALTDQYTLHKCNSREVLALEAYTPGSKSDSSLSSFSLPAGQFLLKCEIAKPPSEVKETVKETVKVSNGEDDELEYATEDLLDELEDDEEEGY